MRLRRLEPVLRRALRGPCRLPRGATLLVAASGGADSTALLVALASLAREFSLTLHAAHLHHGLRGADADDDLHHVRELCERLKIQLESARWDCRARMRRQGLTGEAGLRSLRRRFLLDAARRVGATAIATAHTADDQLETLLMRLARGTGWTGIAGMRARRGPWLKPLLLATRADIEHDLRRHGVSWREDASNASLEWTRNRVRHVVVPALLDALGAPAMGAIDRRAALARRVAVLASELEGAGRLLSRAAAVGLERSLVRRASGPAFEARALRRLSPVLLRLALERAWRLLGPAGEQAPGLTARHLAALGRLIGRAGGRGEVALPAAWRAHVEGGRLWFSAGMPPPPHPAPSHSAPSHPAPTHPAPTHPAPTGAAPGARRTGASDARLGDRWGRAPSRPVAGASALRRRRRTPPHDRTPARPATRQERR